MMSRAVAIDEKTSPAESSIGEYSPSIISETVLPDAQDHLSIKEEEDYPHGIRLAFVVIALVLSMFLVCRYIHSGSKNR